MQKCGQNHTAFKQPGTIVATCDDFNWPNSGALSPETSWALVNNISGTRKRWNDETIILETEGSWCGARIRLQPRLPNWQLGLIANSRFAACCIWSSQQTMRCKQSKQNRQTILRYKARKDAKDAKQAKQSQSKHRLRKTGKKCKTSKNWQKIQKMQKKQKMLKRQNNKTSKTRRAGQ